MLPDPSIHKEKEWFHQIAEGDETAFKALFNHYLSRVHRMVFQVVNSEHATKDIVQEVFLQLWLGRDRLTEVDNPAAWIMRIAYNLSFRYLKKQSLQLRVKSVAGNNSDETHNTEESINLSEVNRLIRQAIKELPPQSRRIFEMSRLEGLKPAEIAEALGISIQGVRNTLTRSGKFIKDYLARYGILIPLAILLVLFP
ncbi:RNA polymerase sigma factor [Flavihumibacter petaseus]|uniref:Putative RNA polymerase ECF-type sigma factor n=1 Tax=Flavihumibacter petaseus NBRC 106054 TaxID=1220578 RepID=A0A0E9MTP3_9BACT|nr:RNA polymerase sigma-70 factor [Flavihumibacter petaseus]GAO41137.1 putative RNA polymerase ECF-type sigma factor [Flavihumibacter petaseus NBRC 106054]